ncbi:hypothetical protein HIM_06262 [Hirsutella minnesotensis 3608]|uniref:Uncharacterized protein n=1 Tax=Hirsutella minnesotensis 3608 TaxID=1043627 RepID=A0A0F7ZJA8_9HYPO|nr:hypothetical protein HIM_06262 [Hirsutella minnesotensis 3608]
MASNHGQKPVPIAIVGMSCRLPGGISTLDDFWTLLSRARSGWGEIPKDRFTAEAYYHPNPQKKGCFNTKGGYFLNHDPANFDAPFFNITRQEATAMDPQQRMLLECSYEALENAGIAKEGIAGSDMGVFVGGGPSDYQYGAFRDLNTIPMFDVTGNHQSILSGRISHYFDLRGPSFCVDTACSSGLYALHQAVQSLRAGECESAIVGACHLHLQPERWITMSMSGLFNPEGKTFAFDHRGNAGFARGEGVGCLILKPLDKALRDNDKIKSIIVHTGANQDGKTVGLSTPSGEAQEQLIRDVYAKAGIDFNDTGFIEAHGTGTKIGDPIEARVIHNVFSEGRTKRQPLYIGSVKTNVGHLENASGIISVIKAAMMLEKGFILPNTNYEKTNENIPLDEWNMKVPTTLRSWPAQKKYISVNNFGFGGSNAHCVLQRPAIDFESIVQEKSDGVHKLFVLSGHGEEAAKARAKQLGIYAEQHPEVFQKRLVRDLSYTLCERRSHMPWRIAITASCCNEVVEALNGMDAKPSRASKPPKIAFVFTGQGAQWHAMGKELMGSHIVFADTMRAADNCLKTLGADFSLLEELARDKDTSLVNKAHLSQPACTAIQLALVRLFSSWGIEPQAVVGHSSGEIGAAFAAGALSLEDAMAIAYFRGQVTLKMKARHPDLRGSMLAVGSSPNDVRKTIKTMNLEGAAVACENSPGSTTVSGHTDAIDKLAAELESRSIFNRKLYVDVAYHSTHMNLVAEDYHRSINAINTKDENKVTFFSSLQGRKLESCSMLTADYWTDNLVKPVLFSPALEALCAETKPSVLVEIGPHAALEGPIKQILREMGQQASHVKYCPSLKRNQNATEAALKAAGSLFVMGQPLAFDEVNNTLREGDAPIVLDDFANYPWTYERYWIEPRMNLGTRIKPFARHDLLGLLETSSTENEHSWRNVISTDDIPWLKEHKMQSLTTFPLAGYISMVTEAASQRANLRRIAFDRFCMREIQAKAPFIMNDGDEYETIVHLRRYAEGTRSYSTEWDEFSISTWISERGWVEHCRGLVAVRKNTVNPISLSVNSGSARRLTKAEQLCVDTIPLDGLYSELDNKGATYGPLFQVQGQDSLKCCDGFSNVEIAVPDTASVMHSHYETPYIMQPAFLDLIFQQTWAILGAGRNRLPSLYMPNVVKCLEFSKDLPNQNGEALRVVCEGHPDFKTLAPVDFSIDAWQSQGRDEPIISIKGFVMSPVQDQDMDDLTPASICYKIQWEDLPEESKFGVSASGLSVNGSKEHSSGANGYANGVNGHTKLGLTNGHVNGVNGHSNGINGTNGHADGANGHANGANGHANGHANGYSNGIAHLEADLPAPVVLVTDRSETDPVVKALSDIFVMRTGVTPTVCPFRRVMPAEKIMVFLNELDRPFLAGISVEDFDKLQRVILTSTAMLWVTKGMFKDAQQPENALSQGLLRTVRSETGKLTASLDLDPRSKLDNHARSELIVKVVSKVMSSDEANGPSDFEFAEDKGKLVVPRVVADSGMNQAVQRRVRSTGQYMQPFDQGDRRLEIAIGTYGALDSLYFRDQVVQPLEDDQVEIKVTATGMNFKDVVIAMGQVASSYLGVECSGIVSQVGSKVTTLSVGDRVCAMSLGAYGTYARCKESSAAVVPDDMALEVAASVPVVFSTAYYGMVELAHIQPGESILIHAASGGVGQAAIQLAQMLGAEIYATVGSIDKKKLIMDKYKIPEDHIFYSRNAGFGPAIREATGGRGVDVVLNSLAGELLRESWESLAHFGRFIEIGKRDITSNTRLDMSQFEHNVTFSSVDLTLVAKERPQVMGRVLKRVMELLGSKNISVIEPITVLGITELESALRTLQGGKSTGKIIIAPRPGEQVKATHPQEKEILVGNATYVIIGGTGGLGRSMAKWMVRRGARSIVLLSRSGKVTPELARLVEDCRGQGATITIKSCDVAKEASVKDLVEDCGRRMPPIRGIIHAAMVLRDMLFEKMTHGDFDQVIEAKVSGTWNFHRALASHQLDFFVVLSSVAGIVGNRGQAAYAAANTFLDAFVQYRVQQGLPATSIDLTAVEDVGYLAENAERQNQILQNLAGSSFGEAEVLALVELGISGDISRLCNSQCVTGLNFSGASLPYYGEDARFLHLRNAVLATSQSADGIDESGKSNQQELASAETYEKANEFVSQRVWEKLCGILMLQPSDLDPASEVKSYGLDSLNAIELRNWIGKEYSAHLQVLELLTSGTIGDLAALVLKKTKIKHPEKAS